MQPKVTIVIPTFNRANMVCRTIDDALAQTYPCQVIVCDHGSSDNTPDVVKKYGDKITYIRRERDFGPHFCWLEGVLHADGEYVHIHMDDDWIEPTFIEETVKLMAPDVGMVFADAFSHDIDKNATTPNCLDVCGRFGYGVHPVSELEAHVLNNKFMLSPAACLYRKKDIIDAIYPGDLPVEFGPTYFGVGPDHFMTLQAMLRYPKFACVDKSLLTFVCHGGSITIDAYKDPKTTNRILAAYEAVRNYYLLLKEYRDNPGILDKSYHATKTTYKVFGVQVIKINRKEFYKSIDLFGVRVVKISYKPNGKNVKIFGVTVIKKRIK